jgi:hypothetical protein
MTLHAYLINDNNTCFAHKCRQVQILPRRYKETQSGLNTPFLSLPSTNLDTNIISIITSLSTNTASICSLRPTISPSHKQFWLYKKDSATYCMFVCDRLHWYLLPLLSLFVTSVLRHLSIIYPRLNNSPGSSFH